MTNRVINILDLMKPDDKKKVLNRFKNRVAKRENGDDNRISNEIYMLAEFGYFFGWEAVRDVRDNKISFEEMFALLEGAKKVWYTRLVESANAQTTAVISSLSKHPDQTWKKGMKKFMRASEVEADNG